MNPKVRDQAPDDTAMLGVGLLSSKLTVAKQAWDREISKKEERPWQGSEATEPPGGGGGRGFPLPW